MTNLSPNLLDSKGNLIQDKEALQEAEHQHAQNVVQHKQAVVYARPVAALEHKNTPFASALLDHADFRAVRPFVVGGNVANEQEFMVFTGDVVQQDGFPVAAELLRQAHFVLYDIVTELNDCKDKIHSARNTPASCDEKVFKAIAKATNQSVDDVKALMAEKAELVKRGA